MSDTSLKKKVVRGFLWQGGASFLSQAVTWAVTIFVIRLLSPSDYGLMAMAGIFIELLVMVSQIGLGLAIIQSPTIRDQQLRQVFGFVLLINLSACILTFLGAPLATMAFGEHQLIPILRVLSINFLFMSLYILPQSMIIRNLDFRKKASVDFFARITSALTAFVLAFMGLGVWALVMASIALHIVKVIVFNMVYPITLMLPNFSFVGLQRLLRFGMTVTGNRILYFLYSQSDRAIAGRMLGKDPLGLYSVALELAAIPLDKLAPIIIQVSFPAFSRIQSDMARVRRNVLKAVVLVSLVFFPIFLGMAAVAHNFIPLVLGQKWAEIVLPFQLICLILPLKAFDPIVSSAVYAIGKPGVIFGNRAIAFAIMGIAFLIGVQGGVIGLCLSWLAAYPLVFLLTTLRNLRVLEIPFLQLLSSIKFGAVASGITFLGVMTVAYVLRDASTSAMALGVLIFSGILIYVFLVYIFNRPMIMELRQVFHF